MNIQGFNCGKIYCFNVRFGGIWQVCHVGQPSPLSRSGRFITPRETVRRKQPLPLPTPTPPAPGDH